MLQYYNIYSEQRRSKNLGFVQFVARSHLGNGIFTNNSIWMKPQNTDCGGTLFDDVKFVGGYVYFQFRYHCLYLTSKILVQHYWSASISPKICVIHLDKLYCILYRLCLHTMVVITWCWPKIKLTCFRHFQIYPAS